MFGIKKSILIIIVIVVLVCCAMGIQTIPKMQYYSELRYNDTVKLMELIEKYPSYPDAYLLLAEKYKDINAEKSAIYYKKAAEIVDDKNFTAAMDEHIASVYMKHGNVILAAKYYSNPILVKYNITSNLILAGIFRNLGRFDQAIDVLDKFEGNEFIPAISAEPDTFVRMRYEFFYKLMAFVDNGSSKNAILQAKAIMYYKKRDFNKALDLLNKYMNTSGKIPVSLLLQIYTAKGDLNTAAKYYDIMNKNKKEKSVMDNYSSGLYFLARRDFAKADMVFSEMTKIDDSAWNTAAKQYGWYGLGLLNMKQNYYLEAIKCFNKVLDIIPYSYETSVRIAECYKKTGDLNNYNKYSEKIKAFLTY